VRRHFVGGEAAGGHEGDAAVIAAVTPRTPVGSKHTQHGRNQRHNLHDHYVSLASHHSSWPCVGHMLRSNSTAVLPNRTYSQRPSSKLQVPYFSHPGAQGFTSVCAAVVLQSRPKIEKATIR
jgi:hypothetical protein